MSRRSSNPRRRHTDDSAGLGSTTGDYQSLVADDPNLELRAATCVAEPFDQSSQVAEKKSGSGRSLDALLASCGALKVALKPGNHEESVAEIDTEYEFSDAEESSTTSDRDADLDVDPPSTPLVVAGSDERAVLASDTSLIASLQQEFRASINELKQAQAASAESQSAVLKTLTEIIFQSSAVRDNGGSRPDQSILEMEDRIVQRISQALRPGSKGESSVRNVDKGVVSSDSKTASNKGQKSWAEIRSGLEANPEMFNTVEEEAADSNVVTEVRVANADEDLIESNAIIDVPRPIDPETLDLQELRAVFYERETFISTLIGKLRHLHQKGSTPRPAEELRNMAELLPDELAAEVRQTLAQLDQISRIGELELSLERARLARQVNQLDNSRQIIEHNARQLGLQLADDGTIVNPEKLTMQKAGSRRWLSKLGFGA